MADHNPASPESIAESTTEAAASFEAGRFAAAEGAAAPAPSLVQIPGREPVVLMPTGSRVRLDDWAPGMVRQTIQVQAPGAAGVYMAQWSALHAAHYGADLPEPPAALYVDLANRREPRLTAILDPVTLDRTVGGQHRVEFAPQLDATLWAWIHHDGDWQSQDALLEFLGGASGYLGDRASDVIAFASTFEARSETTVKSRKNLDNGDTQFTFNANVAGVGSGDVGVVVAPAEFSVYIPIFRGGESTEIKVRFRYAVNWRSGGEIRMQLNMPDISAAVDKAGTALVDRWVEALDATQADDEPSCRARLIYARAPHPEEYTLHNAS